MTIFYFMCFFALTFCLDSKIDNDKILKIKHENKSYDLIEFIEDNKKKLNSMHAQHKAVMVLGMSGTGKSTLINYLNDIPLVCIWKGNWVLDLLSKNVSIKNIATIGHNINSQTFIPAVYKNKDFIYIDNPGFKDTHGLATEVANGFFRQLITSNVKELKFLLLLAYSDLKQNRGQQFRESIKAFSRFIGAFDDNNVAKYLGKSIGIVVTKVDHESANDEGERITKTDEEMKYELRNDLNRTLNDELVNNKLSQNEGIIFDQIIKNFQIEIFSNPKKKGPVKTHQAEAINILIKNKLQYAEKKDLKLRVQISNEYRADLINYISDHYLKFGESFNNELDKVLSKWILKRKKNISDLNEMKNFYLKLNQFVSQSLNYVSFDDFVRNVMTELLSKEEIEELKKKSEVFSYFIELFSEEEKKIFPLKKTWMNQKNKLKLDYYINYLQYYLSEKFKDFLKLIEDNIFDGIDRYINKKISEAVSLNDINLIKEFLSLFQNSIDKQSDFGSFLKSVNENILNIHEKESLSNKEKTLKNFIDVLSNDKIMEFGLSSKRKWISDTLLIKLRNLDKELNNFDKENHSFENNVYTFKGYFANMTSILDRINNYDTKNLKRIDIFAINSVKFDQNYSINQDRYVNKSPDLIIISPRIIFSNRINIDMSSLHIPGYPDPEKPSAGNGKNGKPGLPGFNGGDMLFITKNVSVDFNFISNGGKGGPGQTG